MAGTVKVVRGYSMFGYSCIYIIFEDGTDLYWARSRVLEYLGTVANKLPPGVTPRLGPDATGVGCGSSGDAMRNLPRGNRIAYGVPGINPELTN